MANRGLVIGKFYPPHKGHSFLIETALAQSEHVDVLVCDSPRYHISAATRVAWLQKLHPKATIQAIKDLEDDDNSKAWAEHTTNFLGYAPNTLFSSEDYGDAYAKYMGARHHKVDRERIHVPISATKVRKDVLKQWDYLSPTVRAAFALHVCIVGAESTGTTTLSKALARKYHTLWAPEFGRFYSEGLSYGEHEWDSDEFTFIARKQQELENELAGRCNKLLISDTNAFATRLWHKYYMNGQESAAVDEVASSDRVDLYILTGDEIPYEQDGTRDGEHFRHSMHEDFIKELRAQKVPYIQVNGSPKERLRAAAAHIDNLLTRKVQIV